MADSFGLPLFEMMLVLTFAAGGVCGAVLTKLMCRAAQPVLTVDHKIGTKEVPELI